MQKKNKVNNIFFLGNFVRKILQPAFQLIDSEDGDRIQETTNHECFHFSEAPVKQGLSLSNMSPYKNRGEGCASSSEKLETLGPAEQSGSDLSFLVVKNDLGEKHLFVDLGK